LEVLGQTPWGGTGVKAFDADNDGRLDLFVVDMHSDMWMGLDRTHVSLRPALKYEKKKFRSLRGPYAQDEFLLDESERVLAQRIGFRHEEVLFGNAFYHNEGGGKFRERSGEAGLETFWPWGIAPGDFDNDGYEDVFVTSGMGYPFYYWPNQLMMNQGDGTFRDRAEETGMEPPPRGIHLPESIAGQPAVRSSRCAAVADFDGDGRLDLVVNNFNDQPYYFRNQFPRKHCIAFRLTGTRSNLDAIGAVVRLHQGERVLTRQVQSAGGYLSQCSKTVHFGLGDKEKFEKVEIIWPSGVRQTLQAEQVHVNAVNPIIEPKRDDSPKFRFRRPRGKQE
jgi:hypothetical protein